MAEPQTAFLKLPSGRLCVESNDASRIGPEEPAEEGAVVVARGLRVGFIDMNDRICPTAWCPVMRDGIVIFTDDNHLTATFSRSMAPVFGERMELAAERASERQWQ